ncbi:unnamed protein product [Menidia menidia]|uniref:(Atlantic silverside) hypothetical protein n=1 Tax=Menidia menidia TaxID=238744 RepID=A0A8S4BUT1_9TELE|nr:unnamed protein product [Menidia menidia]
MWLDVNKLEAFEVSFCSDRPLTVKAKISVQVKDNQYSNTIILVTAEAYQEIVSLDYISRPIQDVDQEEEGEGNCEVLNFGDCHVDCQHQESFTLINHSSDQVVRFEWPPGGSHVSFSPQVGHLHAGCSKEVSVIFCSSQPVTLKSKSKKCKFCRVEFQQPLEQVADWDDRQRTVQWQSPSKVVQTDPEPSCSVVDGSQWELDLLISAVCDYAKFSCSNNTIHFKDTMLFQTRVHQLQIVNEGSVKVDYAWQVLMDSSSSSGSRDGDSLTAARPSSALLRVATLLTVNPELPAFTVEPSAGTIIPGATQDFSVRFSPVELAQFQGRLICSIPNLQDGDLAPCIPVFGRSLLPHCHFDFEDSDYISGHRRRVRSPVDLNSRVLEFEAVGFSTPSKSVLNPTSRTYSFKWRCEDDSASPFRCLSPCGSILPGKRTQVCFEYIADQPDTVESFWTFVIETVSLSVPFLLVGTTREPLVYFQRPHLDLGELLVGRQAEQTVALVNGELEPLSFSVLPESLLSEDQLSGLIVHPMSGTVAPKDRLPLFVSLTPSLEAHVSFRVTLKVKCRSEPLTLTVRADCFAMSATVQIEQPDGGLKDVSPNHQDILDFGKVGISEQSTFKLLVSNCARFSLEVNFELMGPGDLLQHLEAKPQTATIEVGKQLQSLLFFSPQNICNLQDVSLNVKVKFGPTFTFTVKGGAVAPSLEFSFNKFNFGRCFLSCPGMQPPSQTLVISNKGRRDVRVPLTFYPSEARRYHEKLSFILNSCVTRQVEVLGQGTEMKLEVEDPRQKKVKLGSLTLGQKVTKQVVLVNRSSLDLSFTLTLNANTPLDPKDLSVRPAGELKLKSAGGSCQVEIQFSPRRHVPAFSAELQAEFAGFFHPLLTVQGCCLGVEVMLDPNHLSFGAVVQRCQASRRIIMVNIGDIGARFHWKTENFPAELSITPAKGYICPGMEVPFEVTFAPVELSNDRRYEGLSCSLEGSPPPVLLTVTGSCIAASTTQEVVNFFCPVRSSQTQSLSVINPTNQRCCIRPLIEGEQWRAAPIVTFEPHQNKAVDITYRPLTMTTEGKKHLGSVFLSFPEGRGMLYSLHGTADPPKAEDNISIELPAKSLQSQLLTVSNWLSKQQRFHVLMETLKPEKPDATVSLRGLKYMDVPAHANRDYNLSFSAYKEGHYSTKVTFSNEKTGEYLFYLVTFKVTPPGILSTITLETTVRRTVSASIQVENPLTTPTCLSTECKCPDISAPPQHTVPGLSQGVLSFEYHPLHEGESTARLSLLSNDLGYFHHDLILKALPPPPEKTVHFSAPLGCSHAVPVKFTNYSRFKTEYSCKVRKLMPVDFIVDESVGASPGFQLGSEARVEVCFEPHQLGEVKAQLRLYSGIGGEYIFPLHGVCLPPKAQGPFSIRAGRSINIPFKNVFLQTTSFSFQVDNPCFAVKGVESIGPKKTQNISVCFEAPPGGGSGPCFGKLTVTSQRSEGSGKVTTWVFYLKGHRPESS